jgi:hypothetical protein
MTERRLSYHELEDGVVTLTLFEDGDMKEDFYWYVEDMPDGAEPGDQYRPEFEDGELVAIHYDEELTSQKRKEFQESIEWHDQMLEGN